METNSPKERLRVAIGKFPTLKAFSEAMNVRYQVVQQWLVNGVPAEYCPEIERVTDREVKCEDLRPDVNWSFVRAGSDRRSNKKSGQVGNRKTDIASPPEKATQ
jgi:DNA-binding transcriptional regulator YdaS (Cro superfamily)